MRSFLGAQNCIVGGDFNLITSFLEKRRRIKGLDPVFDVFKDTIQILNLIDIETINGMHTWNNRRGDLNMFPLD